VVGGQKSLNLANAVKECPLALREGAFIKLMISICRVGRRVGVNKMPLKMNVIIFNNLVNKQASLFRKDSPLLFIK
jgi:hypothetical protein